MKVKVCGLNSLENIKALPLEDIDFLGFIFYPKSPRNVTIVPDRSFMQLTSTHSRTGVFVNAPVSLIIRNVFAYGLNTVQLHGNESPDICKELKEQSLVVIKAFSVSHKFDFQTVEQYESVVDYFLFDTPTKAYGGSGHQFDWSVLKGYNGHVPFFLSGGIGPDDAAQIKAFYHKKFAGIDLNSRFEVRPGVKDSLQLMKFLKEVKSK
ncbi:N-(5'-phosphoribosyl)anthranilate isomerase [Salinivirga cyanobacteriivorans]|uniref:N-(5'-phosphoribosyl)anthranilate isomerase n=1 Tax=Salinivirga cyanobacteriivorans TaxID=1307839 RepID=A0A0S2I299_9BACT|nr:phosphoribosylanthranilate isomerase [Salinivirga cyanobacteriivorans]ALO16359.1 N-(5'-phosphoribosyl)anthranilate isomerase [Salinivirga cyanobacteriivorans]